MTTVYNDFHGKGAKNTDGSYIIKMSGQTCLKEQPIRFFHDIRFMYCRHPFSTMKLCIVEGILSHTLACLARDDFQALHHTLHYLTNMYC